MSGYYNSTYVSLRERNSLGVYCSRSAHYETPHLYYLSFTSGSINTQTRNTKADGRPLRCVAW